MRTKSVFLLFLAIVSYTCCAFAHENSQRTCAIENPDIPQQTRVYIHPEQVHVCVEGIFVEFEGAPFQVAQICQDELGFYVPQAKFWIKCPAGHPNPPWRTTCQVLWAAAIQMIFCLLSIGGLFVSAACADHDEINFAKESVQKLIQDERMILEKFFQILVKTDGLGYTLYGSKPICLSAYFDSVPLGNFFHGCNSNAIKRGWQVWKKYESYFPHPNYLIFAVREIVSENITHLLYFINKPLLIQTLQTHHKLFVQELKRNFEPQDLLAELAEKRDLLAVLNHHEGLLGILLGYGVESSMNFQARDKVWNHGVPLSYDEADFQSTLVNGFEPLCELMPITFSGNPHSPEVKALLAQNEKEIEYLRELYSQGKFLEITLSKLMEHP